MGFLKKVNTLTRALFHKDLDFVNLGFLFAERCVKLDKQYLKLANPSANFAHLLGYILKFSESEFFTKSGPAAPLVISTPHLYVPRIFILSYRAADLSSSPAILFFSQLVGQVQGGGADLKQRPPGKDSSDLQDPVHPGCCAPDA